jgi:hypothetical protein
MKAPAIRMLIFPLIAYGAFSSFFDVGLGLSYRLHFRKIAEFFGSFTPGDDYRRFIPVFDAIPSWALGLSLVAGLLYLASVWPLLRGSRELFPIFTAAVAVDLLHYAVLRSIPAYAELMGSGHLHMEYVLYGFLLAGCGIAWWVARPPHDSPSPALQG